MYISCQVDGSSRGQGRKDADKVPIVGEGAAACVIYKNNKLIGQYVRGLGKCNSVRAEVEAILLAVLICWAADLKDPVIMSDSEVVCNQVNRKWRTKSNSAIRPILLSIWEIAEVFRFRLEQVPRKKVHEADSLCRMFLDKLDDPDEVE